ncbi:hypothetical protein ABEG18_19030 [Alsobacter sp. KACC 23698]|uniref:Uncharacterized protein n=1 Tax=Alsobacter sp. KACC 23698 TaxID=3149229 RepID=A0AAU7JC42_9HYPH
MTIPVPSHRAPTFAAISAGVLVALSCVGLAFSGPDISVGHKVAPSMGGRGEPDDAGLALGETTPASRDVRVVLASPFGPAPSGPAQPILRPALQAKPSPEPVSEPAAPAPVDLAPAAPETAAAPPASTLAPLAAPAAVAAVAAASGGVRKVAKSRVTERRARRTRVAQVRRPGFRPPPFLAFLFR